jgi:hypothetical protein
MVSTVLSLLQLCLQYVGEHLQELSLALLTDMDVEIKQKLIAVVCAKHKLTQANLCLFLDTELRQLNLLEGRTLSEGTCFQCFFCGLR